MVLAMKNCRRLSCTEVFFLLCVTHRSLWRSVGIKNSQEAINKYEAALNSEREAFYRNDMLHLGLKKLVKKFLHTYKAEETKTVLAK